MITATRVMKLIAPAALYPKLLQAKQAADLHTPSFNQRLVAELLKDGFIDRHVPTIRALYRRQAEAMLAALARHMHGLDFSWTRPAGGMFLWARLPEGLDATALLPKAVDAGVAYVPGAPFFAGHEAQHANTLRLSFVTVAPDRIETGSYACAAAISGGSVFQARIYYKIATGAESGSISITGTGTKGHARIEQYLIVPGVVLSGIAPARNPEHSGVVGLTYTTPVGEGELRINGNVAFKSDFNNDLVRNSAGVVLLAPTPGYELFNAQISYAWDDYEVSAYVRNITNEEYYVAQVIGIAGSLYYGSPGEPRTFEVTFKARF